MKFSGKVIAITGAAAGIGRALVLELGKRSTQIVAIDRDQSALTSLKDLCDREGIDVTAIECDITDSNQLHAAVAATLRERHSIDVWVNNAGIAINQGFDKLTLKDFQVSIAVNLTALIDATQTVLPHMQKRGIGTIVNMASVAGHLAPPYMSAYVATKHAVVGFTRSLRAELEFSDSPVRMVLVSPGFVETSMIQKGHEMGFPEWMSWMLDSPEAVARNITKGLEADELEILPNRNGKAMIAAHRVFPKLTIRSSRVFLTNSLKDYLLNRYRTP
jgi:short-subunit dehydrogenase